MSYPVDIKMPISDLEASPAEPLLAASEPERKRGRCWRRHHCGSEDGSGDELIVGKDARRKRCQKFRRRMICFKLFKFVFFAWLFFSLGKAFMVYRHAKHSLKCTPVDIASPSGTLTLPLNTRKASVLIHSSLNADTSRIVYDDSLEEGTAKFTYELKDVDETKAVDENVVVCVVQGFKGTGVGLLPLDKEAVVPELASTTLTLKSRSHSPSAKYLSSKQFPLTGWRLRTLIKWYKAKGCHHQDD